MGSVWERFDDIATAEEVEEAVSQFQNPKVGEYKVTLEAIEATENKDGLPMVKIKFKDVESNKTMYYNQNLQNINYPDMTKVYIAEVVEMIGGLCREEVKFEGLIKLADKIKSIKMGGISKIKVSYAKKDVEENYPKYKFIGEVKVGEDGKELPF